MNGQCDKHQDVILTELKEVKKHLSGKIQKIEDKLFEPDNGLYARVRMNTNFRKTTKRWLSVISVTFVGAIGKTVYDFFKGRG